MRKTIIAVAALSAGLLSALVYQGQRMADVVRDRDGLKQDILVYSVERMILTANRRLDPRVSMQVAVAGLECARLHDLDPMLLFATMKQESNFNPRAVGASGERGLMQITETTAATLGLPWAQAFDVIANTCAGASYLARHVRERGVHRGLLRYNGGGEPRYPLLVMAHYQPIVTGWE